MVVFSSHNLVPASLLPLCGAVVRCSVVLGGVIVFRGGSSVFVAFSVVLLLLVVGVWFVEVVLEVCEGDHGAYIVRGVGLGVVLFISREVMLFVTFFWGFFVYASVACADQGDVWPSLVRGGVFPFAVPMLNTVVLLSSGVCVTVGHQLFLQGIDGLVRVVCGVVLGMYFLVVQGVEYFDAPFRISDGVFGSVFFLATGFHGLHVLVGSIFLVVCSSFLWAVGVRGVSHWGVVFAIWYWHFVDVVWLYLFVFVY